MATVTRSNSGLLTDIIAVQVDKNDYLPAFEKALKQYGKQANIPGFRKGMVPVQVVKKMYGKSVFTDEILRTVETEINKFLEQEKPEIFGQPLATEENNNVVTTLDINNPSDYTFTFEIGLRPEVKVADLSAANITRRNVSVTDEMLSEQIAYIKKQYGNKKDIDTVTSVDNGVELSIVEQGTEEAKTQAAEVKDFKNAESLIGKKAEETFTGKFADIFEAKLADFLTTQFGEGAEDKTYVVFIKSINEVEDAELNEELLEKILPGKEIKTAEAFSEFLKNDIETYWQGQTKNQVNDEIYHFLLDNTTVDLPEAFLKRWLKNAGENPRTDAEVEAEYPAFANSLRWNVITDEIAKEAKLEVAPEEVEEFTKNQLLAYMGGAQLGEADWIDEYVKRQLQDRKYLEQAYQQIYTNKVFENATGKVVNYNDEYVSVEEFTAKQHHHAH